MPNQRHTCIDALRGLAVVWMTAYHFCFDLNHFGWIHQRMLVDPVWTTQRTLIVSLFLFCAGFGQALARSASGKRFGAAFWRRWSQVALASLLVSAGSWWMFPQSFIYFGVLHAVAVMWILLQWLAPLSRWLWGLGLVCVLLPQAAVLAHARLGLAISFLNGPFFNWLGLVSHKPLTQDYVPVLPWLGLMCWGMAAGLWVLKHRPQWLGRPLLTKRLDVPLAALGRWSLSYYLLHQPVLMGLMGTGASLWAWWLTRS